MKRSLFLIVLLFSTTIYAKNTLYDKKTSLLWSDTIDAKEEAVTFDEAQGYCAGFKVGKHKKFRLPTLKELQTIVDFKRYKPAIKKGFTFAESAVYWSSTPFANDSSEVWTIDFKKGETKVVGKHYNRHFRCVQRVK